MRHRYTFLASLLILSRLFGADAAPERNLVDNLRKVSLAFEKNHGQAAPAADFLARGAGYAVWLSHGDAHISLRRDKDATPANVELNLAGARRDPKAEGRNALPGKVNYFIGNDPARSRTDIPTFARVEYPDVYRGIDLAYYGSEGRLEYDFIVAPGADPSVIRLAAGGASEVWVDAAGDLILETGGGEVRFRKPVSYQEIAGKPRTVESGYAIAGVREIRFALGAYDAHYPLVIDPSLAYSTYLGGSNAESGAAIAVGPDGNAFVTGMSYSMDFPLVGPEQSSYPGDGAMFVAKFNAQGSALVYSTYFGNSDTDTVHAIAVDSSGSAYIAGSTMSTDFPLKNPLYATLNYGDTDAFITKFSALGNALVYSTYLGGSSGDYAYGVAVDAAHNAYIAGDTYSTDFPVTSGAYQTSCSAPCGFVTKINAAESALTWSTYFGPGAGQGSYTGVNAVAVDSKGGVYLTGSTPGGLPVTPGAPQPVFGGVEDGFVAKLANTGASLTYCTYVGGSEWDFGNAIAVDSSGNAYVAGETESTDLPVTAAALQTKLAGHSNAFVAKVNSAGTAWQYLTYLGGNRYDGANGIAVDSSGNAIAAGFTWSSNFPTTSAVQPVLPGNQTELFKTTSAGASWSASDTGIVDKSISAIVVNPAADADLFALTIGGLFESVNGGASWSINTSLTSSSFSFLAFSPYGDTAYTALGGELLYVSYDGGATWIQASEGFIIPCNAETALVDPYGNLFVGGGGYGSVYGCAQELIQGGLEWIQLGIEGQNGVYGFAITPGSPGTLYAATGNGVFQASDSIGPTWTAAGLQGQTVSAVAADPGQPSTLYALVGGAVFKSADAGSSWAWSSTGLTASATSLAIAPSDASVLYAGTPSGVFLSKNGAASWATAGLGQNEITALAVDPKFANKVYAATPAYYDGFVAKINPAGSKLVYSTFLGGTYSDEVYGVALDSSGNAFVTGTTQSPDFPTTPGTFQPATGLLRYAAFVAKIEQQTPACSYSVSPSTVLLYPGGGTAHFSVVSPAGCAWTPGPSASWITVTSGTGPGVAPLAITAAANTGAARTGTVTIGDTRIDVTQAAGGCTYSLSSNSLSFPQAGGSQSVNVTAGTGCQWVVTGLPLWLTVTSGASGTGNGTVTLEAVPNIFPNIRPEFPYTINVANTAVAVSQPGTSGALSH
ncbi:MAG: SBBP repeat-containing protein [Bryobacteraceae bacterium]